MFPTLLPLDHGADLSRGQGAASTVQEEAVGHPTPTSLCVSVPGLLLLLSPSHLLSFLLLMISAGLQLSYSWGAG